MNSRLFLLIIFFGFNSLLLKAKGEWKPVIANQQVRINAKKISCDDVQNGIFKEMLVLQVVNLTAKKIQVNFEKELWYNNQCTTCNSQYTEHHVELTLNAGEEISGTCATQSRLRIFSKMTNLNSSELTLYQINHLLVKAVD